MAPASISSMLALAKGRSGIAITLSETTAGTFISNIWLPGSKPVPALPLGPSSVPRNMLYVYGESSLAKEREGSTFRIDGNVDLSLTFFSTRREPIHNDRGYSTLSRE